MPATLLEQPACANLERRVSARLVFRNVSRTRRGNTHRARAIFRFITGKNRARARVYIRIYALLGRMSLATDKSASLPRISRSAEEKKDRRVVCSYSTRFDAPRQFGLKNRRSESLLYSFSLSRDKVRDVSSFPSSLRTQGRAARGNNLGVGRARDTALSYDLQQTAPIRGGTWCIGRILRRSRRWKRYSDGRSENTCDRFLSLSLYAFS